MRLLQFLIASFFMFFLESLLFLLIFMLLFFLSFIMSLSFLSIDSRFLLLMILILIFLSNFRFLCDRSNIIGYSSTGHNRISIICITIVIFINSWTFSLIAGHKI